MSATRTALELTLLLDVEHALVEIDHLLHHGLTTVEELRARYESMTHWPRQPGHGPRAAPCRRALGVRG